MNDCAAYRPAMAPVLPPRRELRQQELVEAAMAKHGLRSASKREKLLAAAQDDAEEALDAEVPPLACCQKPARDAQLLQAGSRHFHPRQAQPML